MSEKQQQFQLSDEDRKLLDEAHKNKQNPEHPANPEHHKHGQWLKNLPKQVAGAFVFGAGATAGSDMVNGLLGR